MPVEAQFKRVAQQMCNLVGCGAAYVFLGCQEAALRHPLLDLLFSGGYDAVAYAGPHAEFDLLQNEQVRARSDLAIESGRMQSITASSLAIPGANIQSVVIVPLERPAGVLGFIALADARPGAFHYGERLLLRQYVPSVARDLERVLRTMCAVPFYPNFRASVERTSQRDSRARALSAQALRQPAGNVDTLEDVTLERQRLELDRLKNEFIAMVSHELRTPLTVIKGYAVLLQTYGMADNRLEGAGKGDEKADRGAAHREGDQVEMTPLRQREYLDIIMEQTSHLEVLISDLLDVTRIHAGRLSLRPQEVDLAALCRRVVQLIQQRVDQQYPERYTLECRPAPDLLLTWSDPDRVRQVLVNLLENAVKYSPDGGLIEIIVAPRPPLLEAYDLCVPGRMPPAEQAVVAPSEPPMVYVTVRDRGIGISSAQHAQLFKPFSRLEHPRASDVPGAGLGLYITYKLVEAMQGSIILASSAGVGTSVTFSLPVMLAAGAATSSHAPASIP